MTTNRFNRLKYEVHISFDAANVLIAHPELTHQRLENLPRSRPDTAQRLLTSVNMLKENDKEKGQKKR